MLAENSFIDNSIDRVNYGTVYALSIRSIHRIARTRHTVHDPTGIFKSLKQVMRPGGVTADARRLRAGRYLHDHECDRSVIYYLGVVRDHRSVRIQPKSTPPQH